MQPQVPQAPEAFDCGHRLASATVQLDQVRSRHGFHLRRVLIHHPLGNGPVGQLQASPLDLLEEVLVVGAVEVPRLEPRVADDDLVSIVVSEPEATGTNILVALVVLGGVDHAPPLGPITDLHVLHRRETPEIELALRVPHEHRGDLVGHHWVFELAENTVVSSSPQHRIHQGLEDLIGDTERGQELGLPASHYSLHSDLPPTLFQSLRPIACCHKVARWCPAGCRN